jgi:hypothetical protein
LSQPTGFHATSSLGIRELTPIGMMSLFFCLTSYQNFSSPAKSVMSLMPSFSARSWRRLKWWKRATELIWGRP